LGACDLESINPPPEVLRLLPESMVRALEAIPLQVTGSVLELAMTDPANAAAIAAVRQRTGFAHVEPRLVTESTFRRFMATRFATALLIEELAADSGELPAGADAEAQALERRIRETDADAALPLVVRLGNYLLEQAVEQRASDIHVEPYDGFCRVRFRVDGAMYTVLTPPQRLHTPLVSRLKIMAGLDISDRRRPQDGHLVRKRGAEETHFRLSTLPTVHGEKCVLRLLKKEAHLADLGRLGFMPEQLAIIQRAARLPQGLVLVTGPTGSGKTTTLHAMLNYVNEPDINIVSLEDPVEATIPGVNHVQVNARAGLDFAAVLRSVLRQDPDVVFVGEMRDAEVAGIAMEASMTGHLVLSTLHTNGVIETFARLADIGVAPHLLAPALQLVVAQRLLRRPCDRCSERHAIGAATAREFGLSPAQVAVGVFRVPRGCRRCLDTGYRGRTAVYEILAMDSAIRRTVHRGGDTDAIRDAAGSVTWLREAGIARALAGETTFDEVRRVLPRG
jgi:type IV pilus assembly protein PilB